MKEDDAKGLILASVAVGFELEALRTPEEPRPTHYKLVAVGGPLHVRWPDGRWFEINIKEIKHPKVPHGKCPVCGHYGEDCTGQ
jgi:hypothetical protein